MTDSTSTGTSTAAGDRRPQLQAAYRQVAGIVGALRPAELTAPTPCGEWDVAALVDHMVFASRRAARLATGAGAGGGSAEDGDSTEHLEPAEAAEAVRLAAGDAATGWRLSQPGNGSSITMPTSAEAPMDHTGMPRSDRADARAG